MKYTVHNLCCAWLSCNRIFLIRNICFNRIIKVIGTQFVLLAFSGTKIKKKKFLLFKGLFCLWKNASITMRLDKRDFTQLRNKWCGILCITANVYQTFLSFYATQTMNHFLNVTISANHEKANAEILILFIVSLE